MTTGTVTLTETTHKLIKKIKVEWTCTSGGAASETTTNYYTGAVCALVTDPDGTSTPSDNYDVTVTDLDSIDVLAGKGADRDQSNTEYVTSGMLPVVASQLTFTVANAGDITKGVIYLFVAPN